MRKYLPDDNFGNFQPTDEVYWTSKENAYLSVKFL